MGKKGNREPAVIKALNRVNRELEMERHGADYVNIPKYCVVGIYKVVAVLCVC